MPVVSVYPNGVKAGLGGGTIQRNRRRRSACTGWSRGAARRNQEFLWSVDFVASSGEPYSLTLTIPAADAGRGPVPDSGEYHSMLGRLLKRLRRLGAIRWHWVIEMTRRHTPHLHMSVWFDPSSRERGSTPLPVAIRTAWQAITEAEGIRIAQSAQCVKRMETVGWLQYASKHGARGVNHYQREREALPESWRERPGRMWGYGGDWPPVEERQGERFSVGKVAFWEFREQVKRLCIEAAEQAPHTPKGDKWRTQARQMLETQDERLWAVMPLSTWAGLVETRPIVDALRAEYERRLAEAGGDTERVRGWYVGPYDPAFDLDPTTHQPAEREVWAFRMRHARDRD